MRDGETKVATGNSSFIAKAIGAPAVIGDSIARCKMIQDI